jgi:hypothetical protein
MIIAHTTSLKNNSLKNAKAAKPIEYLVAMRSYDHLPDMASFSKCWRVLLSCIQQYRVIQNERTNY